MPLVFWAHGGVVSERAGLKIAANQVPWWLANGAYPLHFVWETGFVETLKQLVGLRRSDEIAGGSTRPMRRSSSPGRSVGGCGRRSRKVLPSPPARAVARGMSANASRSSARKTTAGYPSTPPVIRPGPFSLAHFIPTARALGVPSFSTLQLLAPALRVDGFRSQLLPMVDRDINKITVYTMNMQAENDDNCFHIYRKSLLYMVSQIFEPEDDAPILGLGAVHPQ